MLSEIRHLQIYTLMAESGFVCSRCGNSSPESLGVHPTGGTYCRLCLPFSGEKAPPFVPSRPDISLELNYPLSDAQREVSDRVVETVSQGHPVLIRAVTGSGKTELVYAAMERYIEQGKSVGFCTPRRDVVLELAPRIRSAFPRARVVEVCEDHTDELTGDIVVLTAHQLYRYESYFDLLVFDEIDAFPYAGNQLLRSFFRRSVKGVYILLSATPSEEDISLVESAGGSVVELDARYHGHPLPVPRIRRFGPIPEMDVLIQLRRFLKRGKPCFVFAPTIGKARELGSFLHIFLRDGSSVDSKDPDREAKIRDFKAGKLSYLVTTAVLERGVTVPDLQVIVSEADSDIYDSASLVQIAGRVGRKIGHEEGEVVLFVRSRCSWVEEAVSTIERINESARVQGLL